MLAIFSGPRGSMSIPVGHIRRVQLVLKPKRPDTRLEGPDRHCDQGEEDDIEAGWVCIGQDG